MAAGYTSVMITTFIRKLFVRAPLLLVCALALPALAQNPRAPESMAPDKPAQVVPQTWQMLDYLATDYAGAVNQGTVTSASEYAEMREFAATARGRILALPATDASAALRQGADGLVAAVEAKAAPDDVARRAHGLADALLQAYPMPVAPTQTPDLAHAAVLYQQNCASCHGARGHGDGPAAARLDPPPIAFTDTARADQRSALSLYEVISQGLAGTAMASYEKPLSAADRWSLAYYVGSLAYPQQAQTGAAAWQRNAAARAVITNLADLSRARVSQLAPTLGEQPARAIIGYLRAHPDALDQAPSGLTLARGRVAASLAAYRAGDRAAAGQLALSAYLDGVEPVEPQLNARDATLRAQIETAMGAYRTALSGKTEPSRVADQAQAIDDLLARAQAVTAEGCVRPHRHLPGRIHHPGARRAGGAAGGGRPARFPAQGRAPRAGTPRARRLGAGAGRRRPDLGGGQLCGIDQWRQP